MGSSAAHKKSCSLSTAHQHTTLHRRTLSTKSQKREMVTMSDIFLQEDINQVLLNKFVVVIGDSIQRAIYKDIVLLLQKNKYLSDAQLRAKGEFSFVNDELIEGGKKGKMNNGKGYREVRQFQTDFNLVRFYFVTRCYNTYVESVLADLSTEPCPDLVIMNSCLWDISRYGASAVDQYKKNLERLFCRFEEVLPEECMVIWNTTLPISKNAKGGFLVPEVEFMNSTLRLDILEANFYARQIAVAHGLDVLDLHYFLRHQLHRRAEDGIHWDMTAHRRMTNLILTHVCEAWLEKLPGRVAQCKDETNIPAQEQQLMRTVSMGGERNNFRNNNERECFWKDEHLDFNPRDTNYTNFSITRNISQPCNVNFNNRINHAVQPKMVVRPTVSQVPSRQVNYSAAAVLQSFQQMAAGTYEWQPYAQSTYQPLSRNVPHYRQNSRENPYNNCYRAVKVGYNYCQ